MAEMTEERDLSPEIETDQMIIMEETPEIEIGEKEASRNLPDHRHAMILTKEVIDPLPREDHKGILHEEVTEGKIQVEEVAGIILERATTDLTLEIGLEINPNTTMEGQPIILEPVTIVGKDRGMIEVDVVKELHPGKDKETAEEMKVVEEKEKQKMVKVVMLS